jgi:hypothetical protein
MSTASLVNGRHIRSRSLPCQANVAGCPGFRETQFIDARSRRCGASAGLDRIEPSAEQIESVASSWVRSSAQTHFGCTFGLPPGLPGGGITGVVPASGVGACISGSTPLGGHKTPLVLASFSPSGSPARPVVMPSGVAVARAFGAQAAFASGAGAVACGGVDGVGGAWAWATVEADATSKPRNNECLMLMAEQREPCLRVPAPRAWAANGAAISPCDSGSARNARAAASAGVLRA